MKHYITFIFLLITTASLTQSNKSSHPPINWQLMDWKKDGYPGISLEKAYNELLINRTPLKKIIVAIIDDGVDDKHPDLAGMEWTNTKEIAGNNIDDDKNGFVDDVHGWNFVGNLKDGTFEEIREYVRLRGQFENKTDTVALKTNPKYDYWRKIVSEKDKRIENLEWNVQGLDMFLNSVQTLQAYWSRKLAKDTVYFIDIKNQQPDPDSDSSVIKAQAFFIPVMMGAGSNTDSLMLIQSIDELKEKKENYNVALKIAKTIIEKKDTAYFRKKELGDDPHTNTTSNYGNSNTFPANSHGTECAGVIAALRNNNMGGNGITNSVEIMPVRIGAANDMADERDKDVANAIRYAVDNGAQVINMSLGKTISPQKKWVDEAVKYAEKKGVLLTVCAANEATNSDSVTDYPSAYYDDKTIATNLMKIGASVYDSSLVASFSNYGKNTVDVFAPGKSIYTSQMNGRYGYFNGTSAAAPVVAGLAALIWSYYPLLNYKQVRYCIEQSATPITTLVIKPGTDEKVPFSSLSRTGGIVNAYNALVIAEQIAKKKKTAHNKSIVAIGAGPCNLRQQQRGIFCSGWTLVI